MDGLRRTVAEKMGEANETEYTIEQLKAELEHCRRRVAEYALLVVDGAQAACTTNLNLTATGADVESTR